MYNLKCPACGAERLTEIFKAGSCSKCGEPYPVTALKPAKASAVLNARLPAAAFAKVKTPATEAKTELELSAGAPTPADLEIPQAAAPKLSSRKNPAQSARVEPSAPTVKKTLPLNGESTQPEPSSSVRLNVAPGQGNIPRAIGGYDILDVLGVGGMGTVFLAYEPLLDRKVALKLLAQDNPQNPDGANAARFLSEAVLTGRLGHAGIIPIYHIGVDDKHGYFYTMRYLKGRSLAQILAALANKYPGATQEFTQTHLMRICLKVCEAMSFAHNNGVLHRDLKPGNIMVNEFGEVLVMDWGLAKDIGQRMPLDGAIDPNAEANADPRLQELARKRGSSTRLFLSRSQPVQPGISRLRQLQALRPGDAKGNYTPPENLTRQNQVVGTPGYLSPEQGRSEPRLTTASDVYSLGVLMYECLSLQLPVEGGDPFQLVTSTVAGRIIPLVQTSAALKIPRVLMDLVHRALDLNPEERFQNAGELARELSLYLEGRSTLKKLSSGSFDTIKDRNTWKITSDPRLPALPGKNGSNGNGNGNGNGKHHGPEHKLEGGGLLVQDGMRFRCEKVSRGDFSFDLEFVPQSTHGAWVISLDIFEPPATDPLKPHYQIRFGNEELPFIELVRDGKRMQRRFDLRLQTGTLYKLRLELEEDRLRLWSGGQKLIDYKDPFPLAGGGVEVGCDAGEVLVRSYEFWSRGAPLHLPFHFLPDRFYRMGKFHEARELYRQLAESHPDREEGLLAIYKDGLCSSELRETAAATASFARLEGTLYDHCRAMGQAQLDLTAGNIEQAWSSLKDGYIRHREEEAGSELWYALLNLSQHGDMGRREDRIKRYRELLIELDPQEGGPLAYDLLDLTLRHEGVPALRNQALSLLKTFPHKLDIASEALWALCRTGMDEASLPQVAIALEKILPSTGTGSLAARLNLLQGELLMAEGRLDAARDRLIEAVRCAGKESSEGLWAMGWIMLTSYLQGHYRLVLAQVKVELERLKNFPCAQRSYFLIIQSLSFMGLNQVEKAKAALLEGGEIPGLWGAACRHILNQAPPEDMREQLSRSDRHMVVEALFLIGEAHVRMGNAELARDYFNMCMASERALVTRFTSKRMATL